MKSNFLFACAICCPAVFCQAQSGLTINSGTTILIKASNLLSVDGIVLQPSSDFTFSGSNRLSRNTTISHAGSGTYIGRAFKLAAKASNYSGSVTVYYNDSELNGIPEGNLTLNMHNGTAWSAFTTGVSRDGTSNYVRTTGINNVDLEEFTLADVLAALPLTWGEVLVARKESLATVKWQTYDENNTSYFEVERRTASTDWHKVGRKIEAYNTAGVHAYSLHDATITQDLTYYRIKQVDDNGRFTWSKVVSVGALEEPVTISLYPNPAGSYVVVDAHALQIQTIAVYGMDGRLVTLKAVNNGSVCVVDVSTLAPGQYRLQVRLVDGTRYNQSIIKK